MTRKEEINFEIDKHKYHADCPFDYEIGFKRGVEWADEHPKEEAINTRKEYIKKILKILNDYYQIGNGGPIWLETEKDYENVANNIIELEKL